MVLPLQSAVAAEFGFYISSMARRSRQSALVASACGGLGRYSRAVAISEGLEPAAHVCLGIFLRGAGACTWPNRRGLHGTFAGGRSLPAHCDHRGDRADFSRLLSLA